MHPTRRAARLAASGLTSLALIAAGAAAAPAAAARTTAARTTARATGAAPAAGSWASASQQAWALVRQLTLDEKISLVHGDSFGSPGFAGHVPGIPRLGIPDLYLADGPNGVGDGATGVTAFPVAEADAASWDRALVRQYGAALGAEQSGKGNNQELGPTINILRVPYWGRVAETFGEDPYLAGQLGAAEVQGLQSQHVIATPKHFAGNNQETYRLGVAPDGNNVDENIPARALNEIYFPAFRATVRQGGTGSVMCAYNQVNGNYSCQNGDLLTSALKSAAQFDGFVVSDWFAAVKDTVKAANAGLDMEMPLGTHFGAALKQAIADGQVPMSRLDDMVHRILTAEIEVGLFKHPVSRPPLANVSTPAHQQLAAQIAEQGSVLLKNGRGALPFGSSVHSVAVIGYDAGDHFQYTEGGSGAVNASGLVTPLQGITARAGPAVKVSYAQGTLGDVALPAVPSSAFTPSSGTGPGLTASYYGNLTFSGTPLATRVEPTPSVSGTPSVPGLPAAWSARWTGTITAPSSGAYRFSVSGNGAFRVIVGGKVIADTPYADFATLDQGIADLTAGTPVPVTVEYAAVAAIGGPSLSIGWSAPDPAMVSQAVQAAKNADAAVVFVNDVTGEGSDRSSLAIPGDQDQLISAVAAANPHTVVVLNTGGAVLMPWLGKAAAVIESWYPGQQFGTAIGALLWGDVSPSGHLPMTFPASDAQARSSISWPGTIVSGPAGAQPTVTYSEGIDVGYRWYDANGQAPLFPFGYGLSYTTFGYSGLRVPPVADGRHPIVVHVRVTNTGHRAGAAVVQLYLGMPAAAGEPPRQLKAFAKVPLAPGASAVVPLVLSPSALQTWGSGGWVTRPGVYRVMVGDSSAGIRAAGAFTVG
ncbi:MAG: beta-glucosidase family protein [Gemmatimonadota bacterium]